MGIVRPAVLASCLFLSTGAAHADLILFSDASGLSGEAEFTIVGLNEIEIRLRNTSTDTPDGFGSADQLLTSIAFDLGAPGIVAGDPVITGGSAMTGPTSSSVNFSILDVGPNSDVSGEYGYGNGGATGLLPNYVSGNTSGVTPFGGMNLDGPVSLNGPQAGLVSASEPVNLGGLGAIMDEIVITITLDQMASLDFLANGATIEFGSDAAFLTTVPAPGAIALLGLAGLTTRRRRRTV